MSFPPLQGSNDKVQLQPSPTWGSTGWDYSQRMVKVMCWSTGDPNPAAWFPHCCTDGLFTFSSPLSLYSLLLLRPQGHIKLGRNHRQPTESCWGLREGPMTLSTTFLLGENSDSQLAWILTVLKTAITPLVQVLVVLLEDSTVHKSVIAES